MDASLRMLGRSPLAWLWAVGLFVNVAAAPAFGADDTATPPAATPSPVTPPRPLPLPVTPPDAPSPATPPDAPSPATPTDAPSPAASYPAVPPPSEFSNLDNRIQDTKSEVIQLNRDLMVLEEELLFPASTQVAVFVSMDVGKLFDLDSVQLKLDDKQVATYLYTPTEVQALHRGGVQRVYLGNLRTGSHELVAFFTGGGPHRRDYKRGATVKFDKGTDPKYIELRIKDSTGKMQPEFDVKIWQ
jgi:hypothetical protein